MALTSCHDWVVVQMVLVGSLLAFVSFAGPLQRGQPLGLLWIVPVFWFCVHMLVVNILKVLWNGLSAGWTWTFPGQKGLCRDSSCFLRSPLLRRWFCLVLLCSHMLRIGEASHPGPAAETWQFGLCNPSGLNGKIDQIAHMEGQIWVLAETHLSKHGFTKFRHGLKALQAPWKYAVPGAACPTRSSSVTGNHSGVLLLSQYPARAIPHNFDAEQFALARMQVAGVAVQDVWVTVGMLYGLPCNASHKQAKFQTESMLSELIDRVAVQGIGPRVIAGDFNYASHELPQLRRLQELGFREVQECAAHRWGQSVQSTGRGAKCTSCWHSSKQFRSVLTSGLIMQLYWPLSDP
jgi:hypothetical protein